MRLVPSVTLMLIAEKIFTMAAKTKASWSEHDRDWDILLCSR